MLFIDFGYSYLFTFVKGLPSCCIIVFFLGHLSDTSISLKENSVKPNVKADRSGFFIS